MSASNIFDSPTLNSTQKTYRTNSYYFNNESISDKIEDVSKNLNSYNIEANMELINGEEKRNFNDIRKTPRESLFQRFKIGTGESEHITF